MLTLNDVTVRRGANPVVRGLSLTIESGAVFWVTGPNGAGKSSLLRVMAGLTAPDTGAVTRHGGPFRYFHSEMRLPAWSSVGAWDRLVRSLDPQSAPATMLRPPLASGRWIRRLSTGERKRLLLDALLRTPGPLLLDEPYEHLSPGAKAALSAFLRDRARAHAVVVVTNQAAHRESGEPGIRLEAGRAEPIDRAAPRGAP